MLKKPQKQRVDGSEWLPHAIDPTTQRTAKVVHWRLELDLDNEKFFLSFTLGF